MLVPVFCENRMEMLPEIFYDSIPMNCPDCDFPMEMSEALTHLHCSNPKCPSKVAQRLLAIANHIGVKDLGESRANKFIENFGIENPLLIFGYEPDVDGAMAEDISLDVSNKIVKQFVDRNSFTLAEYVRMANLPYIQMSASHIFGDYDDLEEAYNAIERGGVEYIRDRLNIKEKDSEDVSVRALKVYDSLMTFKDDLFEGIQYVTIVKTRVEGMKTLKAVCSTEVGVGFRTKADFYATCNNLYPNIHIEFGSSVTKSTDYLIWAGAASDSNAAVTNKVKKARAYQEQGCNIKIITALEFLKVLETMAGV